MCFKFDMDVGQESLMPSCFLFVLSASRYYDSSRTFD